MMIAIFPARPVSWSVPESGTTLTVSDGSPLLIVPVCWRTKLPRRPRERAGDDFQRDIGRRAFDRRSGGEHLPLAGGVEVTLELLVEKQPAEGAARRIVGWLGDDLDVERSLCVIRHDSLFLRLNVRTMVSPIPRIAM